MIDSNKKLLIGSWITDPKDMKVGDEKTRLDFYEDNRLNYSLISKDDTKLILLNYRIENNILITDQPTKPKIEKTKFTITADNKLILEFGGAQWQYIRIAL